MNTSASMQQRRDAETADFSLISTWLGRPAAAAAPGERWRVVAAADGTPRAALRLVPAIGLELPRVSFHVGCVVHAARELGLFHRQRTLQLGHDHTGASELADIAWARDHQGTGLGVAEQAAALRALLADALDCIATDRARYAPVLVAELPGPRDAAGHSPFWLGLGRHFYRGDPAAALATHGPAWRSHLAPLLPQQMVYTSFLPPAAEAAIGNVAEPARLLLELLEDTGFRYSHHVNVEDAGPIVERALD
jgi:arginine N-succinyltransferase